MISHIKETILNSNTVFLQNIFSICENNIP